MSWLSNGWNKVKRYVSGPVKDEANALLIPFKTQVTTAIDAAVDQATHDPNATEASVRAAILTAVRKVDGRLPITLRLALELAIAQYRFPGGTDSLQSKIRQAALVLKDRVIGARF